MTYFIPRFLNHQKSSKFSKFITTKKKYEIYTRVNKMNENIPVNLKLSHFRI